MLESGLRAGRCRLPGRPEVADGRRQRPGWTPATVVVNGAEGEPGTFKDSILRHNPYQVIEGAFIAARPSADRVIIALKRSFAGEVERTRRARRDATPRSCRSRSAARCSKGPTSTSTARRAPCSRRSTVVVRSRGSCHRSASVSVATRRPSATVPPWSTTWRRSPTSPWSPAALVRRRRLRTRPAPWSAPSPASQPLRVGESRRAAVPTPSSVSVADRVPSRRAHRRRQLGDLRRSSQFPQPRGMRASAAASVGRVHRLRPTHRHGRRSRRCRRFCPSSRAGSARRARPTGPTCTTCSLDWPIQRPPLTSRRSRPHQHRRLWRTVHLGTQQETGADQHLRPVPPRVRRAPPPVLPRGSIRSTSPSSPRSATTRDRRRPPSTSSPTGPTAARSSGPTPSS